MTNPTPSELEVLNILWELNKKVVVNLNEVLNKKGQIQIMNKKGQIQIKIKTRQLSHSYAKKAKGLGGWFATTRYSTG
jgi:hypothetical protein